MSKFNLIARTTSCAIIALSVFAVPAFAGGAHSAGHGATIENRMPDDASNAKIGSLAYRNVQVGVKEIPNDSCRFGYTDGCLPTVLEPIYEPRAMLEVEFTHEISSGCGGWTDLPCPNGNPPRTQVIFENGQLPASTMDRLKSDPSLNDLMQNRAFAAQVLDVQIQRKLVNEQVIDYTKSETCVDPFDSNQVYIPGCVQKLVHKTVPTMESFLVVSVK